MVEQSPLQCNPPLLRDPPLLLRKALGACILAPKPRCSESGNSFADVAWTGENAGVFGNRASLCFIRSPREVCLKDRCDPL